MATRPVEAIEIRRARRRDWPALRRLFLELFPDDFSEQALDRRLAVGFRTVHIARRAESGGPIGFYSVTLNRDPSELWLDYLGVTASARGTGLGRLLLEHCERMASAAGFSSIGLSVRRQNEIAIGLYRSSGYVEDERGERAFILTKELSAPVPPRPTQLPSPSRPTRALDRLLYAVVKPFWT